MRPQDRGGLSGRRRPFDVKPWDIQEPASRELKALSGGTTVDLAGKERREQLIVLALLNHPLLIARHAELLADLPLSGAALDSLRRELLDIAALEQGLDAEKLKSHLSQRDQDAVIAEAMSTARRFNVWFVLSDAALEDAETGLRQMIALHRKSVMLERELNAAERSFAEDPSEGNLVRLNEIREELRSTAGMEAVVEGFGQASGRPVGSVT
jgi:DNA primase